MLLLKYECNEKWKQDNLKSQDNKKYLHSEDYFEIDKELKKIFESYNNFHSIDWGRHAIQTTLGYWIPKKLVQYLEDWDNNIEYKNQYKKEIDKLWNKKLENSQIVLTLQKDISKYISNNWLEEKWFENVLDKNKYKKLKHDFDIKEITTDCLDDDQLISKVSETVAKIIIDKKRKILDSKSSEKTLLLRYKILDRSMFLDFNYTKTINYLYNELMDKNKNSNKQVFKVIKLAEKCCDPFLIDKILEADDFLPRYKTLFYLNLYCDLLLFL
jgi:hypothetical protein